MFLWILNSYRLTHRVKYMAAEIDLRLVENIIYSTTCGKVVMRPVGPVAIVKINLRLHFMKRNLKYHDTYR